MISATSNRRHCLEKGRAVRIYEYRNQKAGYNGIGCHVQDRKDQQIRNAIPVNGMYNRGFVVRALFALNAF
jgi:hypothetical protein